MRTFLEWMSKEKDVFVSRYSSSPVDLSHDVKENQRLYKELGGDGYKPVSHPDFSEYFIYPNGWVGKGAI